MPEINIVLDSIPGIDCFGITRALNVVGRLGTDHVCIDMNGL